MQLESLLKSGCVIPECCEVPAVICSKRHQVSLRDGLSKCVRLRCSFVISVKRDAVLAVTITVCCGTEKLLFCDLVDFVDLNQGFFCLEKSTCKVKKWL